MSTEQKFFDVLIGVENTSGHQLWRIPAASKAELLRKVRAGEFGEGASIVFEEIEVTDLGYQSVALSDITEVPPEEVRKMPEPVPSDNLPFRTVRFSVTRQGKPPPGEPNLDALFERELTSHLEMGYHIHSWNLTSVVAQSGAVTETIVAVFKLLPGP